MKTRRTILTLEILALLLVIGIFIWQLDTMPYLRSQLQAGLHRNLEQVLEELGEEMDNAISEDIHTVNRALGKTLVSLPQDNSIPNQLLPSFFLNASAHPECDAWFLVLPNQQNNFNCFEYKRPDRYRRGQTRTGTWRADTEMSRFVSEQVRKESGEFGGFSQFVQNRWRNVIDSTLVYRRAWTFGNDLLIGTPSFDQQSNFVGLVFSRVNNWYMENVWIRNFFQDGFWTNEDAKAGLERKHLKFGVFSSREDRLIYHSIAYGDPNFEHQLSLSTLDSWFSDWRVGTGFRNAQVAQVADSIFQRNLYLIIGLFVLLIFLLVLIFLSAVRLLRLSRLKTEFVANVTHELKTPLSSIRLVTDTLRLGRLKDPAQAAPMVDALSREVDRLQYLLDTLLDFSRLEQGKQQFQMEEQTVNAWGDRIVNYFKEKAGPSLQVDLGKLSTTPMRLDPLAMEQVFAILIDNAKKYSPGDLRLDLRIKEGKKRLRLSLQDHGIGIRREDQAIIFDKFVRVGNKDVHDVKGHGIGLSIAQAIVKAHGGRISLQSKPGVGSTFTIELPFGNDS